LTVNAKALAMLLGGATLISFSGVWVKLADVPAPVSAFYRVLFGGLFLLIAAWRRGEIRKRSRYHLPLGFLCGLAFALDLIFYHRAILLVGPGLGTLLPNFQVFILSAFGILFLGESLKPRYFVAVPAAFLGLFFIVGVDWRGFDADYRLGVYFGLITAVWYAIYLLLLRKLQSAETGLSQYYIITLISLTTVIFLALDVPLEGHSFAVPNLPTLGALLALGLISQATGWLLITNALPRFNASVAGLALLLQPSLAFVWDVILFGRPTSALNWLGLALALTGIYLGFTAKSKPNDGGGLRAR
jgi:drug/metabolite transporter (DMT)-like permease